jgi:hypothetical protein
MSKSFEDAGNQSKRKWMCFVCGRFNEDYEKYKEHIILEHDESREYIICPVCKAPVRDMKAHFKGKHPARVMPKGLQTRVIVWKDFSPSGKKKRTRRPSALRGEFESKKMGRCIKYKSRLECDFIGCLERDSDIKAFHYENIKIPYYFQGAWHNYIPDLLVEFIDSSVQIWEIKPANQLDLDQNKAKWASAHNHAANRGWEFNVQTEDGLLNYQRKVREQKRKT